MDILSRSVFCCLVVSVVAGFQVHTLVDSFKKEGPFSASLKCEDALEKVNTFKEGVAALKDQEAQIRRGLGIFKIEQPPNKDITVLEKVQY